MLISIQYLRGLAALAVVFSHTHDTAVKAQAGVDVFFIVSGFIIWTVTQRQISPYLFMWQRIVRIVPLYWTTTIIMGYHRKSSFTFMLSSLLFKPYYDEDGNIWPILVAGWTLNYEMFFYVLFGFTLFLKRNAALVCLNTIIICFSLTQISGYKFTDPLIITYTNPLMIEFLAGVLVAEFRLRCFVLRPSVALIFLIVSACIFSFEQTKNPTDIYRFFFWGIPSLSLVIAFVSMEENRLLPSIPGLTLIGNASFSIYLCHPFLVTNLLNLFIGFKWYFVSGLILIVSTAVGITVHMMVEKPITTVLRKMETIR